MLSITNGIAGRIQDVEISGGSSELDFISSRSRRSKTPLFFGLNKVQRCVGNNLPCGVFQVVGGSEDLVSLTSLSCGFFSFYLKAPLCLHNEICL